MVVKAKRIKENALFGMRNRPSDVSGDILMQRVNIIQKANKDAGSRIDTVANTLRGKPVNMDVPQQKFLDDLGEMGITFDNRGNLNFDGSDFEGLPGPQSAIVGVFNRMKKNPNPDGLDMHRVKRFIDENITQGKNGEGLRGRAQRSLENLRKSIDDQLDTNFPEYDDVNTQYSETIKALDAIQTVAGNKMDLTGPNAASATGTLMRRLMGNTASRVNLLDAIDKIDDVAKKFGGARHKAFDTDLETQVLIANELDRMFGVAPKTSLQGVFDASLDTAARTVAAPATGAIDIGIKGIKAIERKRRNINDEAAFKALINLLNE